ncbi:MAG: hypothetical protein ABI947_03070 [Chloroflexota bacterium]
MLVGVDVRVAVTRLSGIRVPGLAMSVRVADGQGPLTGEATVAAEG